MCLLRTRSMLLALALSVCVLALGDAERSLGADPATTAQVGKTADGRPLYVWEPSQSWPGRPQFDPRLDKPVTLWRTGIPLSDVFAAVREQTGVDLGFFPADDQNRRVCVNLYLNREAPPTLREVMVQLGWVTDCAFACARSDDGPPTYFLLSTSIGAGALWRLREEQDAAIAALEARATPDMQIAAQVRESMLTRLPELRRALALTREEAIREYRGKDDPMLLAALDPGRRAIGQFVLSLSEEELEEVRADITTQPRVSELTPEQRGHLREALTARLPLFRRVAEARREQGRPPVGEWDNWAWVEQSDPEVFIGTGNPTGFNLVLRGDDTEYEGRRYPVGWGLGFLEVIVDNRWAPAMRLDSQVDLRRLLGEEIGEEEEQRLREEYDKQKQQREKREQLAAMLSEYSSLSADVEERLSSVNLPVRPEGVYALWQVQEAVAVLSGFHIVSDCFVQDPRSIKADLEVLYPEGIPDLSALVVLKLACARREERHGFVRPGEKGWEWGDAGPFLRFRSADRDLWRSALLPEHVQAAVDGWVDPYVPEPSAPSTPPAGIRVPIEPRNCIWLLEQTTGPQRSWGGRLIYGNPTDAHNRYRHAFREEVMGMLGQLAPVYRLLGTLTDDQWERLHGAGLTWGVDFSPEATDEDRSHGFWHDRREGDVLRVLEPDQEMLDALREQRGPVDARLVLVLRDGTPIFGDGLLLTAYVEPRSAESLVSQRDRSPIAGEGRNGIQAPT